MTTEELQKYPSITEEELGQALKLAVGQVRRSAERFGDRFLNIYTKNQFYEEAPNSQWTNGFWTGELWLAFEHTGEELFRQTALKQTESFRRRLEEGIEVDTHDLGFLYSPSCVAAWKLTGDETAKETALMAADKLKGRFREKGQFIQAWGKLEEKGNYRLIVDCLLNLPLLYWASEVSGDASYAETAKAHIHTALKVLMRPDYSTYHTFYFDPETGEPLKGVTHQGYSADSVWARGQAWAIYGIALSYAYTGVQDYLSLFENVTDCFIRRLPQNLIPYWDLIFGDGSGEPRDSSASAIAVCGLLEMARHVPEEKGQSYRKTAKILMKALYDHCGVKDFKMSDGLLLHGVYGKKSPFNDCIDHGIGECNLWGDYYYLEGLTRLLKDWKTYW